MNINNKFIYKMKFHFNFNKGNIKVNINPFWWYKSSCITLIMWDFEIVLDCLQANKSSEYRSKTETIIKQKSIIKWNSIKYNVFKSITFVLSLFWLIFYLKKMWKLLNNCFQFQLLAHILTKKLYIYPDQLKKRKLFVNISTNID